MNTEPPGTVNGFWMPSVVINQDVHFVREKLFERFRGDGIDTRVFFWPLSGLLMFTRLAKNAVSYKLFGRGFNLPSYDGLTDREMDKVIGHVRRYLDESNR